MNREKQILETLDNIIETGKGKKKPSKNEVYSLLEKMTEEELDKVIKYAKSIKDKYERKRQRVRDILNF